MLPLLLFSFSLPVLGGLLFPFAAALLTFGVKSLLAGAKARVLEPVISPIDTKLDALLMATGILQSDMYTVKEDTKFLRASDLQRQQDITNLQVRLNKRSYTRH